MKRTFKLLLAGAIALMAFVACDDDETEPVIDNGQNEYDDEYYAERATVTSSDSNFTATDEGGEIYFKTEGGSVTLSVSCGTDWIVENTSADLFETSATSSTLTITAEQNTLEQELGGAITLMTSYRRVAFATITVTQSAYGAPEISVETGEWSFPAVGVLTAEIAVEANKDWTAEAGDSWLTVAKTDAGISLTASENADFTERSTRVTLACGDGVRTAYEYVMVSQDARAYIECAGSLSFTGESSSKTVAVESNFEWDYTYDSSNGWFTISRGDSGLTVSVTENDGDSRNGIITLTAGDGAENVAEVQLTVSQSGASAMIFTYNITSANTSTQLPLYYTDECALNCTVNWGDGSAVETVTGAWPSHTYAAAGEYDIIIEGTVPELYGYGLSSSDQPLPITAVKQWGRTGLTSMYYAFDYCQKLASLPEETGDAFAEVTDFEGAFANCTALNEMPEGIFDNCPEATNFSYLFYGSTLLRTVPKNLFAKCPKVTTFKSLFYNCNALAEIPEGLFDGCTVAEDLSFVFYNCVLVKSVPQGLFKDCVSADSFRAGFYGCSTLADIPDDLFTTCTEVTNFESVFQGCSSLKAIPEGLFSTCTKADSFYGVFYACSTIKEIPAKLFSNCTEVTTFRLAFTDCDGLTAIPAGLFDSCTKVETFRAVFQRCHFIKAIPEGLFDNCPESTSFAYAFYNDREITSVPTGLFDSCMKIDEIQDAFYGCSAVVGESPYTEIEENGETVRVHLYERGDYRDQLSCSRPSSYTDCFKNSSFSDIDSIPSGWGGNN